MVQWVKNLSVRQETQVLSLGLEDPRGEGNGNLLQYFCLENPTDQGAWWATVHGVTKSQTTEETKHDARARKVGFMTVGSKLRDSIRLILYP